jgi:hypothetical protein
MLTSKLRINIGEYIFFIFIVGTSIHWLFIIF